MNIDNNIQATSNDVASNPTVDRENDITLALPPNEIAQNTHNEPPVQLYILSREQHDSRFFNRLGFYCAIDRGEEPLEKLKELLKSQTEQISSQRNLLIEHFAAKEKRYTIRIQENLDKIENEKLTIKKYLSEKIPETEKKVMELCSNQKNVQDKLYECRKKLGERKLDIVESAIVKAKENLNSIIETFQKSYEKRFGFNEHTLKENKTAAGIRTKQFELLREQAEKQWQRLVQKMEKLGLDGVNPNIGHWLFYLGVTIAMVCGAYFFAVFALSKGINDSNLPFFLLNGAAKFISGFLTGHSLGLRLLALFGCLIALSLFITLIAWVTWIGLKKISKYDNNQGEGQANKTKDKSDTSVQFDMASQKEFSFEIHSKGSDFLRFWLQILPIVVLIGIVFLIVFLTLEKKQGTAGEFIDLANLDISLTGSAIGVLLTLLFGGLFSIYILKVVEPRSEQNESNRKNLFAENFELIASGALFLLSLFALFFLESKGKNSAAEHPEIIFTYGLLITANGYLLGFALRLRSLFGTLHYLERKTIFFARAVRNGALPLENSLTTKEDKNFKREFAKIQKELFRLVLLKAKLNNQALGESKLSTTTPLNNRENSVVPPLENSIPIDTATSIRDKLKGIILFWRPKRMVSPVSSNVSKNKTEITRFIEDWENYLFPDLAAEIGLYSQELNLIKLNLNEYELFFEQLKSNKAPFCEEVNERIRRLEDSIIGLKIELEKIINEKRYELRSLARQSDAIQMDIHQGYDLGSWFQGTLGTGNYKQPDNPMLPIA